MQCMHVILHTYCCRDKGERERVCALGVVCDTLHTGDSEQRQCGGQFAALHSQNAQQAAGARVVVVVPVEVEVAAAAVATVAVVVVSVSVSVAVVLLAPAATTSVGSL